MHTRTNQRLSQWHDGARRIHGPHDFDGVRLTVRRRQDFVLKPHKQRAVELIAPSFRIYVNRPCIPHR